MAHPVTQGSEAWHLLRLGRPTASEFGNLITPTGKLRDGEMPETYLFEKLAEHITGKPLDGGSSFQMEQGSLLETEAAPFFTLVTGLEVKRMGFCTTDDMRIGCSPDGLIGPNGGLELKCPAAQTHLKYLLRGVVPPQYIPQVQGSMFVTERPWWYFMSYHRAFPPLIVKVERDEAVQKVLREALSVFLAKMDAGLARIAAMTAPAAERATA